MRSLTKDTLIPNHFKKDNQEHLDSIRDWCGDWARDSHPHHIPELFFYSKNDSFLPWEYIEKEVLVRRGAERDFRSVKWDKSKHCSHILMYKEKYGTHVLDFLKEKYFCIDYKENQ